MNTINGDGEKPGLYLIKNKSDAERHLRREKNERNRRLGYASLALGGVVGAGFLATGVNNSMQESRQESRVSTATDPRYTDVEVLRQTGTCADELRGEAEIRIMAADNLRNETNRDSVLATASRFSRSAELASQHEIPCIPHDSDSSGLTPNFDVAWLIEQSMCAEELRANPALSSSVAQNESIQSTLEIEQKIWQVNVELAEKHRISC